MWNAAKRDFERDILALCQQDGMGIMPHCALGMRQFVPKATESCGGNKGDPLSQDQGRTPLVRLQHVEQVSQALESIALRKNAKITSVALANVMYKAPYLFPICRGRKIEHLQANIDALTLSLSAADLDEVEQALDFDLGLALSLLGKRPEDCGMLLASGRFDYVQAPQPYPCLQNVRIRILIAVPKVSV
jgi:aryl-alcohol dehydrogenase-like predicted oxidoreductase